LILGIDAGTYKVGYAILDNDNKVYAKGIILFDNFKYEFSKIVHNYEIENIIVGSGTGHNEVVSLIKKIDPDLKVIIISERNSSVEAKWRYINSLRGIKGLFYRIIGYADKPIDDISAIIIAERYLKEKEKNN
jgi:RNase H-fold protein (predicted Holliday junction resolvase)